MLSDYVLSLIRTVVPALVGVGLAWVAARTGVVVDESTSAGLVGLVAGLATAGYYALVRAVEQVWPAAGWLLGAPARPMYDR